MQYKDPAPYDDCSSGEKDLSGVLPCDVSVADFKNNVINGF